MVRRWLERTPASFTFAAKLPQAITHERRLEGCWRELEGFLALMRPLTEAGRLAALLAQLPPSFDRGCLPALEGFLEGFPEGPRLAVELRHRSWYEGRRLRPEVRSLLARHRAAAAVVSSPLMETEAEATTDLAYVRWHGLDPKTWYSYRYRREELAAWAEPVRALCTGTGVVLAFFNNHPHAYAPENCRELAAMLGARLGSMVPGQRTLLGGQ
jgi:uncharacterized protein YecE (DUF72 family)